MLDLEFNVEVLSVAGMYVVMGSFELAAVRANWKAASCFGVELLQAVAPRIELSETPDLKLCTIVIFLVSYDFVAFSGGLLP